MKSGKIVFFGETLASGPALFYSLCCLAKNSVMGCLKKRREREERERERERERGREEREREGGERGRRTHIAQRCSLILRYARSKRAVNL